MLWNTLVRLWYPTRAASVGLALLAFAGAALADEALLPRPPIEAEALEAFLVAHTGPVLHVSVDSDCAHSLARTTHRIPIDNAFTDAEIRHEAEELFVADVLAIDTFAEAFRRETLVLVVCCAGVRSTAAATAMARHGFHVVTVIGGLGNAALPKHLLRAP
jgi:rhodanese-related sulfurtransferase